MAQFGYPTSDITPGAWTHSTGASHFGALDEVSYDDADYIQLNNQSANTCEMRLNTLTDPQSSINHTYHLRVKKAGSGTITLSAYLVENTTVRATKAITLTTSWADVSFAPTQAEIDSIADYTNLRIRFTGTCAASTRFIYVSWANLEIPDAAATQLVIQDASHTHAADSAGLTQHNIIAIQDASHTHAADTIALIQHNVLAIADANHTHISENVTLVYHAPSTQLVIQDASHGHTADNITLTYHAAHYNLVIQDASHSHGADNISLVQHSILSIADASHGHSADNITLTAHAPGGVALTIADATHGHYADNVTLTAHPPAPVALTIADATHAHGADNVALTYHAPGGTVTLVIADGSHSHEADNVILTLGTSEEIVFLTLPIRSRVMSLEIRDRDLTISARSRSLTLEN